MTVQPPGSRGYRDLLGSRSCSRRAASEAYLAQLAPILDVEQPDFGAIGALAARYGVETVGPPITAAESPTS